MVIGDDGLKGRMVGEDGDQSKPGNWRKANGREEEKGYRDFSPDGSPLQHFFPLFPSCFAARVYEKG
ncbi:hypothetical protein SLEP1_g26336 [Rubroshorea leprosula]|uniref:Uncharacterized protein n=1 Tax=Rubroshorea leprosula TaxID=152421 RepID=A0AAV5JVZ3_9ROSI|nr:hypothetical protein SLEP1_g26336 [Rubroshorea leprosula]